MKLPFGTARGRTTGRAERSPMDLPSLPRLFTILALGAAVTVSAHAQFTSISSGITNARGGGIAWGDYDGDSDLDLVLTGNNGTVPIAEIYTNTGSSFTAPMPLPTGVDNGSRAAWGDYDADGDLDVLVIGADNGGNFTSTLYQYNGSTFNPVTMVAPSGAMPVPGLGNGSISWGDYDNDGDLDLFLTGTMNTVFTPKAFSRVYRNDGVAGGGWRFTEVSFNMPQLAYGEGAWGDYDNDGDLDVAYTGYDGTAGGTAQTVLYRNNGGLFLPVATPFLGLRNSSLAWGDYDNDGDLDLALTGLDASSTLQFRLYRNMGGTFIPSGVALPTAVSDGSLDWGDYDNNGTLDLLVLGRSASGAITEAWDGPGNSTGNFTFASSVTGESLGQAAWGDYDNNGRLDIAATGFDPTGPAPLSEVYGYSGAAPANSIPNPPSTLSVATTAESMTVSWGVGSDPETPTANLHYNVYLYNVTSGTIVAPAMSSTGSGYRHVPALGNAGHLLSKTFTGLIPTNTYDVCVQTVDGSLAGSTFNCSTGNMLPSLAYDLKISDSAADAGAEPNSTACIVGSMNVMWDSPDIWCNPSSTGTTHIKPACSTSTYVHVKVTNIGGSTYPGGGRVQVFYAKASTGLIWQSSWSNNASILQYGDFIGEVSVGSLASLGSTTVSVLWNMVPDPSDFGAAPGNDHFCLLARFVADDDPMTEPETWDVFQNTMGNNNVAWRNISIDDADGPLMIVGPVIEVNNPFAEAKVMDLHFAVAEGSEQMLNNVAVSVDLGSMYQLWMLGGQQGTGVQPHSNDPQNTSIDILANNASIGNMNFPAGATYGVKFNFSAGYNAELVGTTYIWHAAQYLQNEANPFGGEAFYVAMPTRQAGKSSLAPADAVREYKLSAHPNPTGGATTISYVLPSDARVTLAVYDAAGNVVRTLAASAEQKQGGHQIEWNGLTEKGVQASAGTYFYRLEAGTQRAEGQIKIVR